MRNTVYVVVIVVCLIGAGVIFLLTRGGGPGGIESIDPSEMILVKCNNADCGAVYEMPKRDYYKYIEERADPMMRSAPALVCKECGEPSVYRAVKCEECGHVFFYGNPNDFNDRCPECGYSKMEAERKARVAERGN